MQLLNSHFEIAQQNYRTMKWKHFLFIHWKNKKIQTFQVATGDDSSNAAGQIIFRTKC
jgi:hypothetical protein